MLRNKFIKHNFILVFLFAGVALSHKKYKCGLFETHITRYNDTFRSPMFTLSIAFLITEPLITCLQKFIFFRKFCSIKLDIRTVLLYRYSQHRNDIIIYYLRRFFHENTRACKQSNKYLKLYSFTSQLWAVHKRNWIIPLSINMIIWINSNKKILHCSKQRRLLSPIPYHHRVQHISPLTSCDFLKAFCRY